MFLRADCAAATLLPLFERYAIELVDVPPGTVVPGSYWGESEAGLIGNRLYARADTPVHSLLHELSHYICMTEARRAALFRDAGGDDDEECAVCYLQILLADCIEGFGRDRCCDDMDAWGYSFREGSTRAWLAGDAADARTWLARHGLIDASGPIGRLRNAP